MKIKKLFKGFLLMLMITLCIPIKINAQDPKKVIVNGVDIYDTSSTPSAVFDKNTNTLTLNNYSGQKIYFENFEDEETINIQVKGNNIIDSGIDVNSVYIGDNGIEADSQVILNITGEDNAKLTIQNYVNGVYLGDGIINIRNLDLTTNNTTYCTIYVDNEGDVNIYDSKIYSTNSDYGVATDYGNMHIENTYIKESNFTDSAIYAAYGKFDFINSKAELDKSNTGFYIYSEDSNFKDSEITINDSEYGINGGEQPITIDNSKITINNINDKVLFFGIYTYGNDINIINNSEVIVNSISNRNYEEPSPGYGVFNFGIYNEAGNISLDNSTLKIINKFAPAFASEQYDTKNGIFIEYGKWNVNNSEVDVEVDENGIAFLAYTNEDPAGDLINITGESKLVPDYLKPITKKVEEFNYTYYATVIAQEKDAENLNGIEDLMGNIPNKFSIIKPKKEDPEPINPQTGDKIYKYIGVGLISIIGLSAVLYYKKVKESK